MSAPNVFGIISVIGKQYSQQQEQEQHEHLSMQATIDTKIILASIGKYMYGKKFVKKSSTFIFPFKLTKKIDAEAMPKTFMSVFINVFVKDTLMSMEPLQSKQDFFFDGPNAQMEKAGINRSAG